MSLTRTKAKLPPPGVYQLLNGQWKEVTTQTGKEQIHWYLDLSDTDGNEQPLSLYATEQSYATVNAKGKLTNPEGGDVSIPSSFAAGMFMDSLEDHGFSGRKLKDIDANPGCADGTWVRLDHAISDKTNPTTNQPYVNVVVSEILDGKPSGKGGSSKKSTEEEGAASTNANEEPEGSGIDATEDEIEAAQSYVIEVVNDPDSYVANFDEDANNGGVTLTQLNTSVFKHYKGKGAMKVRVAALVGDPAFHTAYGGGWTFDGKKVVSAKKKGKK